MRPLSSRFSLVLVVLFTSGCFGSNGALRLRELSPERAAAPIVPTVIGAGDLVAVRVWNSEQMAITQRVRPDGTIALFFMDTLPVAGQTTADVAAEIARRLDGVLVAPRVSVMVQESAASIITIVGEVNRPGSYPVHRAMRVVEALALAGGLNEYARRDRILLQRGGATPVQVRLTYDELLRGDDRTVGLALGPGDVLIVR
jgi:polysaccharide biosynthesis/export protein